MIYFTTLFGITQDLFFLPIVKTYRNIKMNEMTFIGLAVVILALWLIIDKNS